jgi:hypothetical protein
MWHGAAVAIDGDVVSLVRLPVDVHRLKASAGVGYPEGIAAGRDWRDRAEPAARQPAPEAPLEQVRKVSTHAA